MALMSSVSEETPLLFFSTRCEHCTFRPHQFQYLGLALASAKEGERKKDSFLQQDIHALLFILLILILLIAVTYFPRPRERWKVEYVARTYSTQHKSEKLKIMQIFVNFF